MELELDSIDDGQHWVDDGDQAIWVFGSLIRGFSIKFIVGVAKKDKVSSICVTSPAPTFRN